MVVAIVYVAITQVILNYVAGSLLNVPTTINEGSSDVYEYIEGESITIAEKEEEEDPDYKLLYSSNNDTVTGIYIKTGYTDDINLEIPSKHSGKTVTTIGSGALQGQTQIKSVKFSSSITEIQSNAFANNVFTSLSIPWSVRTIGESAFSGSANLETVTFATSSNLITIGNSAFSNCTKITTITLPNSVRTIGNEAFIGCSQLKDVTLSSNLKTIGESAFKELPIEKITIPSTLEKIGKSAFQECKKLTEVKDIEKSKVTVLADYVFDNCSLLKSINLHPSLTSIGESTFGASGIEGDLVFPSTLISIGENAYHSTNIETITIPKSLTTIEDAAFYNCQKLTTVTDIEKSKLTVFSTSVFKECILLKNITFPTNLTEIGNAAFYNTPIESVTLGKSITKIGKEAFYSCNKLGEFDDSIIVPSSVKTIDERAFYKCQEIKSVTFNTETKTENEVEKTIGIQTIGSSAFEECIRLSSIILPKSLTSLGANAFSGCKLLTSATLSSEIVAINNGTFCNCEALTEITIPEKVALIGEVAFSGCKTLTSIIVPSSVKTISSKAFENCTGLTSATIKMNKVASDNYMNITICANIFIGCTNLSTVTFENTNWKLCEENNGNYNPVTPAQEITSTTMAVNNTTFQVPDTPKIDQSEATNLYWVKQ